MTWICGSRHLVLEGCTLMHHSSPSTDRSFSSTGTQCANFASSVWRAKERYKNAFLTTFHFICSFQFYHFWDDTVLTFVHISAQSAYTNVQKDWVTKWKFWHILLSLSPVVRSRFDLTCRLKCTSSFHQNRRVDQSWALSPSLLRRRSTQLLVDQLSQN